jgi:hypothetical protein
VALSQAVHDLRDAEPEHPEVDDSGHQGESEGAIARVGAVGLHSTVAARTGVARDLHVEDLGLGGREVGDGPSADLERLSKPGTAVATPLHRESERRRVGNGAFARAPRVALLATRGARLARPSGPSVEHSTGGDPPGLGGEIARGEERGRGLDAPEFFLRSAELLPELAEFLLHLVGLLQALADCLALLGVESDRLLVVVGGEQLGRVLGVHVLPQGGRQRFTGKYYGSY